MLLFEHSSALFDAPLSPLLNVLFSRLFFLDILNFLLVFVAEPPELSGPHAPIIVSKTSDQRARVPNDSRSLSGVLGKPESSTF